MTEELSQPELDSRPGSIFIANETRSPGLVLLCPVTRSGNEAILWLESPGVVEIR